MPSGGHNRKPTKSKVIQGTFRKDREPVNEPEPTRVAEVPTPPSHLPTAGKRMWKRLAAELVDAGILTVVDLPALEVCCLNYGIYVSLWKSIFRMIEDPDTGKRRRRRLEEYMMGKNSQTMPEYTSMTKAFSTFKSYLIEFGLTPASRSRVEVPRGSKDADPMEGIINAP